MTDTGDASMGAAARFLRTLMHDDPAGAHAILDANPDVARSTIRGAAAVCDADRVAAFLASDPGLATRAIELRIPEPIVYASHGALPDRLGVPAAERVRTVALLLDAGASPNAYFQLRDDDPHTRIPVLYFASVTNNVEVVRLLVARGALLDDGESVFHAAEMNHRETLELLLAHGADLGSAHAHWGNTPLYFLAGHTETSDRYDTAVRGMEWLLTHGAGPDVPSSVTSDDGGADVTAEAPLHRVAQRHGTDAVARLLVAHGATVDQPRGDGRTPYALAMRSGNVAVAAFLRSAGADPSRLDASDRLLAALHAGDADAAHALLAADPALRDALGADARQALMWAVERDNTAAVTLMLSLGWTLEFEGPWGGTPLHWAAWFGRVAMVRLLLSHGAHVNARDSQYGSSPIAWAAHGSTNARRGADADYVAIVDLLITAGATRAESFNRWGESPESMASDAVAAALGDFAA